MNQSENKKNIRKRFVAGLIDYVLLYTLIFAYLYSFGEQNNKGGFSVTGIAAIVPFIMWFTIIVLTEVFFSATLGNSIMNLKPKSLTLNNGELTFGQSISRHLFDPIDMFPFGIIGILTIKNSSKNQRLGDIIANTTVVEVKKAV
ncbi:MULTISPECIES: RDD family protein [unclassified Flavobacterium]|uniref:RDD family protein n=1 Tax=unclassified Flavobacterium TaxID=196869 RepID=UPI0012921EFF|nr:MULTISPECIES: RDD family protein [unclassified Flavobacterium]MQP51380.1 RDD family protein [Flavobacterium sp. LMO9]MQP61392.1 RDD family protein [Flavobacterium sp. LMO6]